MEDLHKYVTNFGSIYAMQEAQHVIQSFTRQFVENSKVITFPNYYLLTSNNLQIKMSKKFNDASLIRDAFVGLMCLNHLRLFIPNFQFILGIWEDDTPYIKRGMMKFGDPLGWNDSVITDYIAYEDIPGITLKQYLDRNLQVAHDDIVFILWQLCHALKVAHERYNFIHGNLHLNNIIIRPEASRFQCVHRDTGYDLNFNFIATITDYSQSSCRYNNVNYHHNSKQVDILTDMKNLFIKIKERYPNNDFITMILDEFDTYNDFDELFAVLTDYIIVQ